MYLVSVYFDEKTNRRIQQYINKVAECTGNSFMIDGNVPPHMTLCAFEAKEETQAIEGLRKLATELQRGAMQCVSVGQFLPYVLYITPVLNAYLHDMIVQVTGMLQKIEGIKLSPHYQPFQWMPHVTIGKTLNKEQMQKAFIAMQEYFSVFDGEIVKIGLAKPNPHRDIILLDI